MSIRTGSLPTHSAACTPPCREHFCPPMTGLSHLRMRGWPRKTIVYYLERSDGLIKIGCTGNYPARRTQLLARHGVVNLIAFEVGDFDLEQRRHEQFAHLRADPIAEWFRHDDQLLAHIVALRPAA